MKKIFTTIGIFILLGGIFLAPKVSAQVYYDSYSYTGAPYYPQEYQNNSNQYIQELLAIISRLETQLAQQSQFNYYPTQNYNSYGQYQFTHSSGSSNNYNFQNDAEPNVRTLSVRDTDEDSAELRGEVDMNDFNNGIVFFVYGQDEDNVKDVQDDYDDYEDVQDDERNDQFEVIRVDRDLDNQDDYEKEVRSLEKNERYYVVLCVEYEDYDNDEALECGTVKDFKTDR